MKNEKQTTSEEILKGNEVITSMIENSDILNLDPGSYVTKQYKSLMKNKTLSTLIKKIPSINFAMCYAEENGNDYIYSIIEGLNVIILNSTDLKEIADAKKKLKEFEPKLPDKITLIINNFLMIAQRIGIEIGTDYPNYYYYDPEKGYWVILTKAEIDCLLSAAAHKSGFKKLMATSTLIIKRLYDQYIQSSVIPIPERNYSMDSEETKINLKNGTFVIGNNKRELVDFDSADFFKYVLPFDYDPVAVCPLFDKFLNEVMPDKKSQLVMAEYISYIFKKDLKLEKCLVLVGGGANGKSVFFDIINALLGHENVSSFSLSSLTDDKGYHRAELGKFLLNYSSELGGKNTDTEMAKQLISNEPVGARSVFERPFTLSNYCRFMFNTNILPRNVEQSYAYFRRFIFIEFNVTIPKEQRDPDLSKRIIRLELSGIFNWVLQGLLRLEKQRDFTASEKIEETLSKVWKESDSVALYMENRGYRPSLTEHQTLKFLYSDYKEFCNENRYHSTSNIEFKRRLELQKFIVESKKTNNATWVYCGNSTPEKKNRKETMDIVSKFASNSTKN